MEDETKKMEIERALKEELPTVAEPIRYKSDQLTTEESELPFFKKPALLSCSKCGKKLTHADHLKTHERIHTGEKPFSCSKCDMKIRELSKLKFHDKINTGEKPFSCSKCDKAFRYSGDLQKHERIHTDEKPFSCSKCVKKFKQSG